MTLTGMACGRRDAPRIRPAVVQTLVSFAIRTRRIPFFRSHPSLPLTLAAFSVGTVGALLPTTPLAQTLGFRPLPGGFFAALAFMVACYLTLIEVGKRLFYGAAPTPTTATPRPVGRRHLRRRAAYFSTDHQPRRGVAHNNEIEPEDPSRR